MILCCNVSLASISSLIVRRYLEMRLCCNAQSDRLIDFKLRDTWKCCYVVTEIP